MSEQEPSALEGARKRIEEFERRISKDKLRFAVCDQNGQHSGVWSAWGNRGDFYVGARNMLGSMKISLHASGVCRVALTEKHIAMMTAQGLEAPADRAFVKWRRKSTEETGAVHIMSLVFPLAHLRNQAPTGTEKKPVVIFGATWPEGAVEFGFFFSRLRAAELEQNFLRIGQPFFRWKLENGESVSLVARKAEFDPATLPKVEAINQAGVQILGADKLPSPGSEMANLVAAFWNTPKDNESLRMIEVSGVTIKRNE